MSATNNSQLIETPRASGNPASLSRPEILQIKKAAGTEPYEARLQEWTEAGRDYRAFCPWHETDGHHNPSLAVYRAKEGDWRFKCLSKCNRQGDVIQFVQLMDGLSFRQAVAQISDAEIPASAKIEPEVIRRATPEEERIAYEYLRSQGVEPETALEAGVKIVFHPTLGIALAFVYDADAKVAKYRAVRPEDPLKKFLHASGRSTDTLLYNIAAAKKAVADFVPPIIYVTESERDCLLLQDKGYVAVSVSSASSCVSQGKLKIAQEQLDILAKADVVILAADQDPKGIDCAAAFENDPTFNPNQVKRLVWPYGGKRSKDPKDIGELYLQDPIGFCDRIDALTHEAVSRPPAWRQAFKTIGELDRRPIIELVNGFMTEGNIGLGGLSGAGKTFVALSIAKALTTGHPLFGEYTIPEIRPVLYLCPEVNERALCKRAAMFQIPDDESLFLTRTMTQGPTLPLDHPHVISAIRNLNQPIVFLDTAIRWSSAESENSATDNVWMERAMRGLREAGALAVVALHHSPKSNKREHCPTLENTFRGSTDIGAVLDIAYSVRKAEGRPGSQVMITNVKDRDFLPPRPFYLGLKDASGQSFVEKCHDLVMMAAEDLDETLENKFEALVSAESELILSEVADRLGMSGKGQVSKMAERLGWKKESGKWLHIGLQAEKL